MFKRILLPVDPAKAFAAANQYAVDLAHKFGSTIHATYIIDDHLLGPVAEEAATSIDRALEWVGRDAMDDFCRQYPDLTFHKNLTYGATATALFNMVLQTGSDVVVLGGYHAHQRPHWASTVVDIVKHCERPVFVVRESGRIPAAGDRIVVPFDGSDRPVQTLPKVAQFAKECGAAIDLVYVARTKDEAAAAAALDKGAWIVEEHEVLVATHVLRRSRWRSKARTVMNYARESGSPLIALSRLGRTGMATGHSRTVSWLLSHSPVPVWVVRK